MKFICLTKLYEYTSMEIWDNPCNQSIDIEYLIMRNIIAFSFLCIYICWVEESLHTEYRLLVLPISGRFMDEQKATKKYSTKIMASIVPAHSEDGVGIMAKADQ